MRRFTCLVATALLAQAAFAVAEAPPVTTKMLGEDHYELTVTLPDTTEPGAAQRYLETSAIEVCGNKSARFDKYKFESSKLISKSEDPEPTSLPEDPGPTSLTLHQEVLCLDAASVDSVPPAIGKPAPKTPPSPSDEALIRTRTLEYLAAKDAGDFDSVGAMHADSAREMLDSDPKLESRIKFIAAAGGSAQREVIRVTWYDDPPSAPEPGRYAAADYRASFESGAFYCGYLVWMLQGDGAYRVVSKESGEVPPDIVRKVSPNNLPALRTQMACRD